MSKNRFTQEIFQSGCVRDTWSLKSVAFHFVTFLCSTISVKRVHILHEELLRWWVFLRHALISFWPKLRIESFLLWMFPLRHPKCVLRLSAHQWSRRRNIVHCLPWKQKNETKTKISRAKRAKSAENFSFYELLLIAILSSLLSNFQCACFCSWCAKQDIKATSASASIPEQKVHMIWVADIITTVLVGAISSLSSQYQFPFYGPQVLATVHSLRRKEQSHTNALCTNLYLERVLDCYRWRSVSCSGQFLAAS